LSKTSDGQRTSLSKSGSDISDKGWTIVGSGFWGGNWLGSSWILGGENLPNILISTLFHVEINN
jgi:hypothetical protein